MIGMNELQVEEFIQVKFLKTFYIENIHDSTNLMKGLIVNL